MGGGLSKLVGGRLVPRKRVRWESRRVRPMMGSAHADGWFGLVIRPTSLSLLNSATVDSAHSSSGNLRGRNLRIVVSAHSLNW